MLKLNDGRCCRVGQTALQPEPPDANAAKKSIEPAYEPTAREQQVIEAARARFKATRPVPAMIVSEKGGVPQLGLDHPDVGIGGTLLMEALGTADYQFLDGLLMQLANVGSQGGKIDERGLNFMLSVVKGVEPKDQVEAMLAAQMAAVHLATMTFARRLANVEIIPQQDSAERSFNKLARTFIAQIEALKRYRTGGEQKVTVQHVHVHEGGQAIVGTVEHPGGGAQQQSKDQPHALGHAPGTPMPSAIEADREAVPITSG